MASRNYLFGLDLRSLALFRICVGLVVVVDQLMRAVDLRAHYTDFGVLPRAGVGGEFANMWHWSIHMANGSLPGMGLLFLAHIAFGLAMAAGYRTRLATIATYAMAVSLQSRNPMVVDGGDVVLRLLLFWSMFLPLGAIWSIDARRSPRPVANPHFSVGSVAYLGQLCLIYWFNAINKSHEMWRSDFTAVYYALSWDAFATSLGLWVRKQPLLTAGLTAYTMALEAFGPFLLFVPVAHWVFRSVAVLLFIGLHVGFAACMQLGVFPFILMSGWLAVIPGQVWDRLGYRLDAPASVPRTTPETQWERFQTVFCAFCLVYVTLWNIRTIDTDKYSWVLPRALNVIGHTFRIDQRWNMFAPRPSLEDGWFVIPGRLKNGTQVDLLSGASPPSYDRPASVVDNYVNQRWRKYRQNMWARDFADHRPYYARYLCRAWNETHTGEDTLQSVELVFMLEETTPFGVEPAIEKKSIGLFQCQ